MGQILTNITFEEWIRYIFDHPVVEGKSYWTDTNWDVNDAWWNESEFPVVTVSFMTQLFENAGEVLAPYSDAQLQQSLWYIDSEIQGYMYTLTNLDVPLADRLRCVQSIYTLFEQVFAVRCSPEMFNNKSVASKDRNILNLICYMWWDLSPLYGGADTDDIQAISSAALDVMRKTLELDSIACQESALHGLGHWTYFLPKDVDTIIDTWFKQHLNLRDALKQFAINARTGLTQ